jgi:hypothetical protein
VDIVEGASCIYGAPVGRSIALVEGVVDGFTASGRVWVRIVRRAYGGGWSDSKDRVHVGPDRLVIVDALPACDLPTDAEKAVERRKDSIARFRERRDELEAGAESRGSWDTVEYLTERLADLEAKCP